MRQAKIFHQNEKDAAAFFGNTKYWSNSLGELHHHGEYDINEEDLPEGLRHAYYDLFFENETGSLRYLVDTEKGFGIALINEYDQCYADDCGISMNELFQSAVQDAKVIASDPLFEKADISLGEFMGFNESHELLVIFPANIPAEEFFAAATRLDELAYESAKMLKKQSLDNKIQAAQDASSLSLDERVELLRGSKGYEAFSYDYEVLKNTASDSSLPGITASVWLEKLSALSFDDLRSYVDHYTVGTLDPSHTHDYFVDSRRVQQKQEKHVER